ncbi:unnamed protein product [Medioppia subpectinata]|uniref:RING-type domain-containing protein n=1 Tax=Medioppia subpectinata TaxID=1979941 RepID=A0A7R9KIR3_9ACAR|nr:unnamed protein product [Medioppia subpectinata]CAG2104125.1 unnamed protein product [Medioppia subpectinata]
MPGYPTECFVDLSPELADEIQCSICLCVLCDAVDTKCRHSYCYECIEQWLTSQTGAKLCPECKQSVANKYGKNSKKAKYNKRDPKLNALLIGNDVVVYRNRRVNAIIGRLRVKCEWEANGCPHVMALDALAGHSANCEYRVCDWCGLLCTPNDGNGEHDCVLALLSDRDGWRDHYVAETNRLSQNIKNLQLINDQLVAKCDYNKNEIIKLCDQNKVFVVSRNGYETELNKLRKANVGLVTTLNHKHNELIKLQQENKYIMAINNQKIQESIKQRADNSALQLSRDQKHNELTKLRRENESLVATRDQNNTKLVQLQRENQTLLATRKKIDHDIIIIRRENSALQSSRDQYHSEITKLKRENESFVAIHDKKHNEVKQFRLEIEKLVNNYGNTYMNVLKSELRSINLLILPENENSDHVVNQLRKLLDTLEVDNQRLRTTCRTNDSEMWQNKLLIQTRDESEAVATQLPQRLNRLDGENERLERLGSDARWTLNDLIIIVLIIILILVATMHI